ncbi:hypothetical protein PMIN06_004329 [Paraphaeosphaeria minitans]
MRSSLVVPQELGYANRNRACPELCGPCGEVWAALRQRGEQNSGLLGFEQWRAGEQNRGLLGLERWRPGEQNSEAQQESRTAEHSRRIGQQSTAGEQDSGATRFFMGF